MIGNNGKSLRMCIIIFFSFFVLQFQNNVDDDDENENDDIRENYNDDVEDVIVVSNCL